MRVLLVGASGTLGRAVRNELAKNHEIIEAGRTGKDVSVDISSPDSIASMYRQVGRIDAVVSAAGHTHFGPLKDMTPELNEVSIQSKLKGQVNLVLLGIEHLNDGGSFTLTTGVIMDEPIAGGASAALAGGAIQAFVRSAAFELPRGLRINNVSPNVVKESIDTYGPYFPGFDPVPASKVALAYMKSVEGIQSGQTFRVY